MRHACLLPTSLLTASCRHCGKTPITPIDRSATRCLAAAAARLPPLRVPPSSRRRPATTLRQLHLRATSSSGTASGFHAPAQPGTFFIPRRVRTGCKGSMFFSPALVWVGAGCLLLPALYWVGVRALGLGQQVDAALARRGRPTASATWCIGIWLPQWGFSRVFIYRNSGLHRSSWGLLPMLENLFLLTNFVLACSFFVLRTHICLMVLLSGGVCWSAPGEGHRFCRRSAVSLAWYISL